MTHEPVSILTLIKNGAYIPAFVIGAGVSINAVNALALLLVADTLLGVLKAGRIGGWRSVTSARLAGGVISKMLMLLIPFTLATAAHGIDVNIAWLIQSSITVLILSETYSVLGNIHAIQTGKEAPEFDAVQYILRKLRDLLDQMTSK